VATTLRVIGSKLCPKFDYYAQTMPIIFWKGQLVYSNNYIKPTMYNITIASQISNQA